jgi:hypothetical protein
MDQDQVTFVTTCQLVLALVQTMVQATTDTMAI